MIANLICYLVGQLLHMWLKADAWAASQKKTHREYLSKNIAVLVVRFAASSCVFVIFTEGGAAIFGESFMPSLAGLTPFAKGAVCMLIGLAADSILDKVMVRIPWLQNEIPPPPTV